MKHCITFCLLAGLALPAAAELYQWKDENGRLHFSDKKPGSGNVTSMQAPAAQSTSGKQGAAASANGANPGSVQERQRRVLEVMQQESERKEQARLESERASQQREKECRKLREQQSSFEGRALYRTDKKDENGELIWLDDKERAELDQKMAATLAEKCS